jgi:hypothetical protein
MVLSCFACKEQEHFEVTQISESKELELVKTTFMPVKCATGCVILDSLLMMTTECDFHCFSLYNKFTHEFVSSFIEKGHKEFDFDMPFLYTSAVYDSKKVLCYDLNKMRTVEINVDSIIKGGNPYSVTKFSKTEKGILGDMNLSYITDNKIVGNNSSMVGDGMFFIYDTQTKEKQWIDYSPKYKYEDIRALPDAYYNVIAANKEKQSIAVAFWRIDMVSFYNSNGSLKKQICFSELKKPATMQNTSIIDMNEKIYFINIFATQNYCYAIRYNMSNIDLYMKRIEYNPLIIKFDWDGNIIGTYNFNEQMMLSRQIVAFCVDDTRNRMYIVVNTENPEFQKLMELQM